MTATQAELQQLKQARAAAAEELSAVKAVNKDLVQKSALLDSLSAETEALRHQVR